TRTCTPVANRAGVRGFFSFLCFLTMTGPPLSLPVILQEKRRTGQGPAGYSWWQARTARPTAAGYNDSMKILFLHGWQSVPGGVKPTFLAQHGHEVINPKPPDEDFEEALRIAQAEYDRHRPDVVAGSSRGGAPAMHLRRGDPPLV